MFDITELIFMVVEHVLHGVSAQDLLHFKVLNVLSDLVSGMNFLMSMNGVKRSAWTTICHIFPTNEVARVREMNSLVCRGIKLVVDVVFFKVVVHRKYV